MCMLNVVKVIFISGVLIVFEKHDISVLFLICVWVFVGVLLLTTGHVKDPASSPEHGQTKHHVVKIDLIFGKCSFDSHGDTDRKSSGGS